MARATTTRRAGEGRVLLRTITGCTPLVAGLLSVFAALSPRAVGAEEGSSAEVIGSWSFDRTTAGGVLDSATGREDPVLGRVELVPGVRGRALRLDGFRTHVRRERYESTGPAEPFTVEAWIALASHPWSWAPVVDCSEPEIRGFSLAIGPEGRVRFALAAGSSWHEATTERTLPLREWVHLAAVFEPNEGLTVFLDGEEAARTSLRGNLVPARYGSLTIGRSLAPRTWNEHQLTTEDACFFLDGALDELRISRGVKHASELRAERAAAGTLPAPALSDRSRFPKGPVGSGTFGAFYTKLDYYPEWDDLWRVSEVPDLFVRFDRSPVQLVFWRGTSFVPCWVSENDLWYTNEWLETWGSDVVSCAEPIMDRQCRYSHVRLIESNDARVVVHWRYALSDARYDFAAVGDDGRGEWCDEFHIIYPDQVGVRKMQLHHSKPERKHDWVEQIVVLPPGARPDDAVERSAVSLVNLRGEVRAYSWHEELGVEMTEPEGANISYVHLRSEHRPFVVVPDGPVETVEGSWDSPFFRTYASKLAVGYAPDPPPSVYGWWNHWPVAQVPGDGRWVVTPDRPSHFNLTTFVQWNDHGHTPETRTRIMLQGMTSEGPAELASLARSWLRPPTLTIVSGACRGGRYDPAERAYRLEWSEPDDVRACTFVLEGSAESPIQNPAHLVASWGDREVAVTLDERASKTGADFRQGIRRRAEGEDLVLWLELESTEPVRITLRRAGDEGEGTDG